MIIDELINDEKERKEEREREREREEFRGMVDSVVVVLCLISGED